LKRACAIFAIAFAGAAIDGARAASVVPAPGVGPHTIAVASLLDLSGPLAAEGAAIRNGLTMAFGEINAQGGVGGRTIAFDAEDTGYDPAKARAEAEKLAGRVFAVMCSNGTPPVSASMPVLLNRGVLHLFPFSAADRTYVPAQPLEFTLEQPVTAQVREGLDALIAERGELKVGVLARDDSFGHEALAGAEAALASRGGRIAASALFAPGAREFSAELKSLRRAGAQLVVIGGVAQDAIEALKQAHLRGWYPAFLCPQTCYNPDVVTLGGHAVTGLYAVAATPIPYPDGPDAALRDWVRSYEARFATVASARALRAYLDGRLFAEALSRAGPHPTQRHFARVLEDMPPWRDPKFGGLAIDFTPRDHLGLHTSYLAQIRSGHWVLLNR
jgi:branched-chain amino acid transport system substrate-binding protein